MSGVTGKTGHHVQGRVGLEHKNVYGHVPDHAQILAAKNALVSVAKLNLVKQEIVQVNAW